MFVIYAQCFLHILSQSFCLRLMALVRYYQKCLFSDTVAETFTQAFIFLFFFKGTTEGSLKDAKEEALLVGSLKHNEKHL